MPEMNNVVLDEVIESEWGNDIRDRTIQRYASVGERSSLNASPQAGDLAFMEDSGIVYVYYSGSWRALIPDVEVSGSVEVAGPVALPSGSDGVIASLSLAIPATWQGWACNAVASFKVQNTAGASPTTMNCRLVIAGTNQPTLSSLDVQGTGRGYTSIAVSDVRAGITATGSQTVTLEGRRNDAAQQPQPATISLYARARRTA